MVDSLVSITTGLDGSFDEASLERLTIREVYDSVSAGLKAKQDTLAPKVLTDLIMLKLYAQALLKEGPYRKGKISRSILDDESVFTACRIWLLDQEKGTVTPHTFARGLNEEPLPRLGSSPKRPIGVKTAYRWLTRLGFTLANEQKGVYVDGHERQDVIYYRTDIFLPETERLGRLCTSYEEVKGG